MGIFNSKYCFTIEKVSNIFLSSLVPVIGFTLSTLSLGFIRKIWEKRNKNQRRRFFAKNEKPRLA